MKTVLYITMIFCGFFSEADDLIIQSKDIPELLNIHSKQAQPEKFSLLARQKEEGHFFRSFLPSVSATIAKEAFKEDMLPIASSTGWQVQGKLNLFNAGKDWYEENLRESKVQFAEAQYQLKKLSLLQNTKKAYWNMIYNQMLIKTIQLALDDNSKIQNLAEKRIRAGISSPIDRLEFKLNGIRLKQDLQKAQNELRTSMANFKALTMIPLENEIKLTEILEDDHEVVSKLKDVKVDFKKMPVVSMIQAQADIELNSAKQNSFWYLPQFDIYAGYERPTLRQDDSGGFGLSQWYAGVSLSFNLGELASSVVTQQARNLDAKAQIQLKENVYYQNENNFKALIVNIQSLHSLFHDAEESIKESESYVKKVLSEYDRGVKNSIDALNATRQAYDARKEGLGILRDYKVSIVEYSFQLGIDR